MLGLAQPVSAAELGLPYLDTGQLYRAVGRPVLDAGGLARHIGAATAHRDADMRRLERRRARPQAVARWPHRRG